jgi:Flp pilus assembly protein TadG
MFRMVRKLVERLRRRCVPVLRDRRGATAMMFAFMIIPIFASVGLAVDSSMGYLLKSRMSKSLDTAGLAAGRLALNDNAEEIAQRYFDANFDASGGSANLTDFDFELSEDRRFVTLVAVAETPTLFMRVFGRDTMTVTARTRIRRETTGMELALVLDNTGSMWGTNFDTMQDATYELIEILYGDEDEIENLWISLVPYTATINIGPSRTGWLAATDRVRNVSTADDFPAAAPWKGCVRSRANPLDAGDAPPSAGLFTSFYYASTTRTQDNRWDGTATYPLRLALADRNDGRGPNLGCGPAITPLTKSRATIEAGIGNMGPWHRGGTTGNLGLSWGWRTISPGWRALWGGETPNEMPLDYGTPNMDKVVVILTDGQNQFYDHDGGALPASDFTAYGRVEALGVTTIAQGRTILDTRMAGTCTAMKNAGIRIYSITFGGPDATAQNLFRNCATTPAMYTHAPSPADLRDAFRAIGGELANLRIVE